jgi:hypothetical protein
LVRRHIDAETGREIGSKCSALSEFLKRQHWLVLRKKGERMGGTVTAIIKSGGNGHLLRLLVVSGDGAGLQAVQERHGTFGMRCSLKHRPLVILQDLQPAGNIGGVIIAGFNRQTQISGKENASKFGNEFLAGVRQTSSFRTIARSL